MDSFYSADGCLDGPGIEDDTKHSSGGSSDVSGDGNGGGGDGGGWLLLDGREGTKPCIRVD